MKTKYATSFRMSTLRLAVLVFFAFFSMMSWGQVAAWQFGTPATTGDEASLLATTYDQYIDQPVLYRGSYPKAYPLGRGFSSSNWNSYSTTYEIAHGLGAYYEFQIHALKHYHVSLSSLKARLRRSTNGPNKYKWQYTFNGIFLTDMGSGTLSSALDEGGAQPTIDLTKFPQLQNVGSDSTVTIRLYAWGADNEDGTFAFGRTPESTTTNSLEINGTVKVGPNEPCLLSTLAPANIQANSAYGYGKINDLGFPTNPTHYGLCWNTEPNPTIQNNKTDKGNAMVTGQYNSYMTNLKPSTTYYVRAYAINAWGVISYGTQQTFTTVATNQSPSKEYVINFTGSGDNATVDQVLVENLSQAKSISIAGSATLYLNSTGATPIPTKLSAIQESATSNVIIYPNPASETSTLSFNLTEACAVNLNICDVSGKRVSNFSESMTAGAYKFKLPVLKSGIYFVTLVANDRRETQKLISVSSGSGNDYIIQNTEKIELVESAKAQPQKVGAAVNAVAGLAYVDGDQLRITGIGGRCKTIIMDSPTRSKTVDIKFIKCIDADNNAYAVVKVGLLYWMAENLKATKKADLTSITKVANQAGWAGLTSTSDAYCYYGDVDANATTYGGLYTYHAATSLAPAGGWRLPAKGDIHQLASFIDGRLTAGTKLKEIGSTHWTSDNVFSTNETGFNAVPAGIRTASAFSTAGTTAAYWTETSMDDQHAAIAKITSQNDSLEIYGDTIKTAGLSVRYVYDVPDTRVSMMKSLFSSAADSKDAEVSGLPLPNKTVMMAPDKELFFTGRHDTSLSPQLRFMDNPAATSAPYIAGLPAIASGAVKWWQNPKKVTTMVNENGRESTVIAVWNEAAAGQTFGYKNITLHIIGDSSVNYSHQSIVLPDKFWLPTIVSGTAGVACTGKALKTYDIQEVLQWEMTVRTGDVNNDGTPDILVAVHDTLRIYDGKTFTRISQRGFYSDFKQSKDFAFYLRVEVADMNRDGNNDVVVMTSTPKSFEIDNSDDLKCSKLHLFLNGDITQTTAATQATPSTYKMSRLGFGFSTGDEQGFARVANFTVGDINSDGFPEIVILYVCGTKSGNTRSLVYCTFNWTNESNPFVYAPNGEYGLYADWSVLQPIVLAKLKGPNGPNYIVNDHCINYLDASGAIVYNTIPVGAVISDYLFITKTNSFAHAIYGDQIVVGNFDKDPSGREMLYYMVDVKTSATDSTSVNLKLYSSALNQTTNEVILNTNAVPFFSDNNGNLLSKNHYPVIAGVNTRHTGRLLEFQRHRYLLTKPTIDAVLAASPFYAGWCSTQNSPYTSWGRSASSGSSNDTVTTHTATAIIGFEHEFELPVLAVKIGGVEFSAKASRGFSSSFSTEKSITYTDKFIGYDQNMVVLTSTPYDAYYYKIMKSENPKEIGSEVMFGFPRYPITQIIPVDYYNQVTEGQNVPKIDHSIFNHTVGYPFSYPSTGGLSNIPGGFEYSSKIKGVGVSGASSSTIALDTTSVTSEGLTTSAEFELVFTVADLKEGAGYGYDKTITQTTTIGRKTEVEGLVPSLLLNRPADIKTYNWKLVWYKYQKSGTRFQVVNYIVQSQ